MNDSDSGPSVDNESPALATNNRQNRRDRGVANRLPTPEDDQAGDDRTVPEPARAKTLSTDKASAEPTPAATDTDAPPALDGTTSVARPRKPAAETATDPDQSQSGQQTAGSTTTDPTVAGQPSVKKDAATNKPDATPESTRQSRIAAFKQRARPDEHKRPDQSPKPETNGDNRGKTTPDRDNGSPRLAKDSTNPAPPAAASVGTASQSPAADDSTKPKSAANNQSTAPEASAEEKTRPPEPEAISPATKNPVAGHSQPAPEPATQSQETVRQSREQSGEETPSPHASTPDNQGDDQDMAHEHRPRAPESPAPDESTAQKPDTSAAPSPRQTPAIASTNDPGEAQSPQDAASVDTEDPAVENTGRPKNGAGQPPAKKPTGPTTSAHVSRARLTSGITRNEPVDRINGVFHGQGKSVRRLYYFTEIKGLRGETVTHNWWHNGRRVARVPMHVGSNAWRTYSSKKLIPRMAGPWRVVVTDSRGNTLSMARFVYKAR